MSISGLRTYAPREVVYQTVFAWLQCLGNRGSYTLSVRVWREFAPGEVTHVSGYHVWFQARDTHATAVEVHHTVLRGSPLADLPEQPILKTNKKGLPDAQSRGLTYTTETMATQQS